MEILSQTDILENPAWVPIVFIIGCIMVGFGFAALIESMSFYSDAGATVSGIVIIIGLVCIIVGVCSKDRVKVDTGRDRYEVIINESVDTEEFLQKYEIIEQRDRIWVIEDKDNSK
jgi:hypothetical protein